MDAGSLVGTEQGVDLLVAGVGGVVEALEDLAGGGEDLDGSLLEVLFDTAVGLVAVGGGVAELSLFPAVSTPDIEDVFFDDPCAGGGGPVDKAVVEAVEAAEFIWGGCFVGLWVAELAGFSALGGPLVFDCSADLMSIGIGRPVDRAALEVVKPADLVRCGDFICDGVAQ